MKTTNSLLLIAAVLTSSVIILSSACSSGNQTPAASAETSKASAETPKAAVETPKASADEKAKTEKGIGEIMHVELSSPLNAEMITRGKSIYEMKCSACHKLTGEKLVGPGWGGVTNRRTPEWIMNMITNTDVMLDKDPEAQKMLETCLVRMPNQGLGMGDCRDILEFMRKNDNQK